MAADQPAPAGSAGLAEGANQKDGVDLNQMLDLQTPWCLMVAATLRIPNTSPTATPPSATWLPRPAAMPMR